MGNCILLDSIKNQYFISFSMLEKIIEICPDELWNKKVSGYVFWQQLIHTFAGSKGWLREEKIDGIPFSQINGKNIYSEFENDPETILAKDEVKKCCNEVKEIAEKWFAGKDDDWLKSPYKIYDKINNFDQTVGQIRHIMYHIGHCEAIFRENGIKPEEYLDYYG
jgi:hypothetical protein